MIGPSPESRGGIASVIRSYKDAGLFARWPIRYLSTHVEGNRIVKLFAAVQALSSFAFMTATRQVVALHVRVAKANRMNTAFRQKLVRRATWTWRATTCRVAVMKANELRA